MGLAASDGRAPLEMVGAPDFADLRVRLATRVRDDLRVEGYRDSAVLVPILVEPGAPARLILTRRQAAMRAHAGQIAFPGGQRDEEDIDHAGTAVREMTEELGVPAQRIDVLGLLDSVPTPSGYNITPIVARVAGPVAFVPAEREVAEAFAIPLSLLRDPTSYASAGVREFFGVRYEMHEYHVEGRRIWGATARILFQLLEVLGSAA